MKKNNNKLDQFYTNPLICNHLVEVVKKLIPNQLDHEILEPSAGTGNFIDALIDIAKVKRRHIIAYDIEPKADNIEKKDYLKENIIFSDKRFVIGNPPFGYRGKLALEFLNKALSEANYVAMILPNIFQRYSIQKQVNKNAKLIYVETLGDDSFIVNDRKYDVKCVFQIWTIENTSDSDMRIKEAPAIRHQDFKTFIHNNTENTLKYFDKSKYKWDFAVHRQGYYDYNLKITNPKKLIKNRQYFFVKVINDQAWDIINKIDFKKLSKSNTQVYGFSTTDFVEEYKRLKGEKF
ncbi:SAM-dependent methyltransferase [[Mycoplasma] phocae]|uniref:SAM-dependent methyltransferase n=1 Tax=[Mycoplasma] phocae TaxID=142651 RepID=A0A2Z5IQI7_9BACT|nr:SAM-dependent methyltransferase [[Mycoplasma] phocae]AXE60960.1 SAM-dependent methyltransferase [[Mycoplasma] phocae]